MRTRTWLDSNEKQRQPTRISYYILFVCLLFGFFLFRENAASWRALLPPQVSHPFLLPPSLPPSLQSIIFHHPPHEHKYTQHSVKISLPPSLPPSSSSLSTTLRQRVQHIAHPSLPPSNPPYFLPSFLSAFSIIVSSRSINSLLTEASRVLMSPLLL